MQANEPGPAAQQVAIALLWRQGRLLVALRPPHVEAGGCWEFPGGKVEPGEEPAAALRRECREELAVEVTVLGLAWQAEVQQAHRSLQLLFFHAHLAPGESREPQPLAADALAWRLPTALLSLPFCPADRALTLALHRGLVAAPQQAGQPG